MEEGIFNRTELLLGKKMVHSIAQKRVILFGVGGVGSWCAESLIRSGIHHLTIVDSDCVCTTNINRQLMATTKTIGRPKVEVLRERLLDINPNAEIQALQQVYCAETADSFHIETYDYILDAIDSLENKALLIRQACETPGTLFIGHSLRFHGCRPQDGSSQDRHRRILESERLSIGQSPPPEIQEEQTIPKQEIQVCIQRGIVGEQRRRHFS